MLSWLLMFVLTANVSGTHFISKAACSGESVVLLTSSLLNIDWTAISIHFEDRIIATWIKTNSKIDEILEGKMFLDRSGDIRILNITTSDEGIYTFALEADNTSNVIYTVQFSVHVAPSMNCKPEISRLDMVLHASLEGAECGKPKASVHFLEYPDMSNETKPTSFSKCITSHIHPVLPTLITQSNTVAKLHPGKEAGTYIACMMTPSLSCARNSKPLDFCSFFTIHESTSKVISHSDLLPVPLLCILLIILLLVVAVLAWNIIQFCLKRRKRCYNRKYPQHEVTEQLTCDADFAFLPSNEQPQETKRDRLEHGLESVMPLTNGFIHVKP